RQSEWRHAAIRFAFLIICVNLRNLWIEKIILRGKSRRRVTFAHAKPRSREEDKGTGKVNGGMPPFALPS
ncbi:MAG TPA: hypothetical protein PLE35_09140, partial [Lentisphaeria bacterium]|nr:hypothetical protein [Lentisphaeria bacterium]